MDEIDLGFAEERDTRWLSNRYFPSKVGGKPAWLVLDNLPSKEQLQCQICQGQKSFLCQIYAPYEEEHNFHRSIYVFICRTPTCQTLNSASNLTVLRSQLARNNSFYSQEPPAEGGNPLPEIAPSRKLCVACGCLGPLSCGRCKKANYCCAQHQRTHWPHHKSVCSETSTEHQVAESAAKILPDIVFPEWEIVIEPNEAQDVPTEERDDAARLLEYEQLAAEGKTGALANVPDTELDKYAAGALSGDDKHFRKLKKEVAKDPEQILRYKRNGQPLWIADESQTFGQQPLEIPKCQNCGGERQFEFQIMPQLLLLLKDDQLDWGVLAIYTCANSCQPPNDLGYLEEHIVKQDILPDTK